MPPLARRFRIVRMLRQNRSVHYGAEAAHQAAARPGFPGQSLLRLNGNGVEIFPRHGLQLIEFAGAQHDRIVEQACGGRHRGHRPFHRRPIAP